MLITNATLVTWEEPNQILEDFALYISDGKITRIGPRVELEAEFSDAERLDAKGQYVLPGNICAHTHFYGAFARGLAIPGPAPKDFPEILQKLWWPLDKALDNKSVRASVEVMLVDAIRHGTTTLIDHHASPNAITGSLDIIGESVHNAGLRAVLCYEVTDRDGPEKARAGIAENVRFLEQLDSDPERWPLVRGTFGLHAGLTLSDDTLEACRESAPGGTGYHIHVAEHEVDEYDSLNRYGLRIVDRLHRSGILGPRSIVAHAIHVDAREISLLADSGTWVTHQARSNMNNGVGVAEVESMQRMGIPICLGTDGFSHTMWTEWKTVYLLHKVWHRDPRRMNGMDVIAMGVQNNASLAKVFFPKCPPGLLTPGAAADLIFVDYKPFTPVTAGNIPWHILFGFQESMVTTTIVAGKVLMKDRELLTIDEEAVFQNAQSCAPGVWERYAKQF